MRPERVVKEVRAALPDDGIISLDSGVHHNWFMQFWEARRPQAMLNSWGFSAMGFGVSGILGAKLAAPNRPCLAVIGDGGFTMTPHVLATAVEYDIPAVWLVWNNFSWAAIRDIQYGMFDGREIGTGFYAGAKREPYSPDFAAMARSYGVEGHHRQAFRSARRCAASCARTRQAVSARRACRRQGEAARHRHVAAAADAVQGAGLRQAGQARTRMNAPPFPRRRCEDADRRRVARAERSVEILDPYRGEVVGTAPVCTAADVEAAVAAAVGARDKMAAMPGYRARGAVAACSRH